MPRKKASASFPGMRAIVLSGGSGTRLWPLSRKEHPKQYLALESAHSLLQDTLLRIRHLELGSHPIVVGNAEQRFEIRRHLQDIEMEAQILLEPAGRNTAPALAAAAILTREEDPDALLLVLPADHRLTDLEALREALVEAYPGSQAGSIVVFGIRPERPHTGYGYVTVKAGTSPGRVIPVEHFQEKPDLETAERLIEDGRSFWNSGMFLMRADVFLEELGRYAPDILQSVREAAHAPRLEDPFVWLEREAFLRTRSESIDYAVMERTERAVMVALNSPWSDLGSFDNLLEVDHDASGNRVRGDVRLKDVSGSYIHSTGRLIAAIGLKDAVVIETPDAVLVSGCDRATDVKALVEELERAGRREATLPNRVQRPWGWYESVSRGPGFQVKRIQVDPGAHLSLQTHRHRSEHWVVIRGCAEVVRGEEAFTLEVNQSTYIPAGTRHRLANTGTQPVEIIEVQTGEYLGEDDIVRHEDLYGRCQP